MEGVGRGCPAPRGTSPRPERATGPALLRWSGRGEGLISCDRKNMSVLGLEGTSRPNVSGNRPSYFSKDVQQVQW